MAKMIEEIERKENANEEQADGYSRLASEHSEDLEAFFELLEAANKSGIITFLKALFERKGSSMDALSDELVKPDNIRFIRNLMSIYTLLSNIDPDRVRSFMLNLANAVDKSESMRDKGGMGLLALRANMMDPDVSVGFRVLFETAKGFTRESKRKE